MIGMPTVNSGPPFVLVEDHSVVAFDSEDPFVRGRKSVYAWTLQLLADAKRIMPEVKTKSGLMLGLANNDEPPGFNSVVDDDWLPEVIERAIARDPMSGTRALFEDFFCGPKGIHPRIEVETVTNIKRALDDVIMGGDIDGIAPFEKLLNRIDTVVASEHLVTNPCEIGQQNIIFKSECNFSGNHVFIMSKRINSCG